MVAWYGPLGPYVSSGLPRTTGGTRFVSSGAVAEAFHDDESFEDDATGPLLPPEDRLWRHPSEVTQHGSDTPAHVSAARERWLTRTPTRAGAWTAGIVGAVLATGVVLIGTHLTIWVGRHPATSDPRTDAVASTLVQPDVKAVAPPGLAGIADTVRLSLTVVHVSKDDGSATGNGVVMSADGSILVPLGLVVGGTAITVTTADGAVYSGRVVGSDPASELAVVQIRDGGGDPAITPMRAAPDTSVPTDGWLCVEWSHLSDADYVTSELSMGSVSSVSATVSDSYELLDTVRLQGRDLDSAPIGAVILSSDARLLGIITGRKGDNVVEIPGALAEHVGSELAAHGRVTHGWLGIEGRTTPPQSGVFHYNPMAPTMEAHMPPGVEVLAVRPGAPAAEAGLKVGDIIEAVDGQDIDSMQALQDVLYVLPPGADVSITIQRGRAIYDLDALLQPAA